MRMLGLQWVLSKIIAVLEPKYGSTIAEGTALFIGIIICLAFVTVAATSAAVVANHYGVIRFTVVFFISLLVLIICERYR